MMKKVLLVLVFGVVGTLGFYLGRAPKAYASRCIQVEPICPPGKHAICLCESDISMKCSWVCASE